MKPNAFRKLNEPPRELSLRVMAEVTAWQRPTRTVRWLVSAQMLLLVGLLFISPSTLPTEMTQTAETLRDWSGSVVEVTTELTERLDKFFTLDGPTEIL